VNLELFEQALSERLPGSAFEQHVVREHDRGTAVDLQDRFDVLNEVDLLVGGRDPEVIADDLQIVFAGRAVLNDYLHRGLRAERGVGQYDRPALAGVGSESL
jgi:hypothetical protein